MVGPREDAEGGIHLTARMAVPHSQGGAEAKVFVFIHWTNAAAPGLVRQVRAGANSPPAPLGGIQDAPMKGSAARVAVKARPIDLAKGHGEGGEGRASRAATLGKGHECSRA